MIDAAYLVTDEGSWTLVLEDSFGTHSFPCDPQLIEDALEPWRWQMAEAEAVRQERIAVGRPSWDEYAQVLSDADGEQIRELADHFRKAARESGDAA